MQTIVRPKVDRERERIIAALMNTKVPKERWKDYAKLIDEMSRVQQCNERYRLLIEDLERGVDGEKCQLRAANALKLLWGVQ